MHTQRRYATCFGMSKIKDAYQRWYATCFACQKKREDKDRPYLKKEKQEREREMIHKKEFIHHPPKISTHLHILMKVYDLFLLWIRFLT